MNTLFSLLYVFHFSSGLLVTEYTRCDNVGSKLSYNTFYGSKLVKQL